jgi:hypothetical protein
MSTLMRRAGIGALILVGLLAGREGAWAQFGQPPGGANPFTGQRQYLYNLQMGRAAMANSMVNSNPAYAQPFAGTAAYNPYMAYGGNPYAGYGANPYSPGTPGVAFDPTAAGSNPYSPLSGAADPYAASPYSAYSAYSNPYSNPAAGPGITLMGAADVMRAYGTVITKQEQARIMRQEYYRERLKTKQAAFDLDMYIKNNTPDFNKVQEKITKSILGRIQNASNPVEIVEGRSLNFLMDDVDKNYTKIAISDIPLDENVLKHLNIKPAGLGNSSLGLLRDGGKLQWPSVLMDLLSADVRSDLEAKAQLLAQNAINGKERDLSALKDLRIQVDQTMAQLLKKANSYGTPEYQDAKRFLNDLDSARLAIERGNAGAQVQFQALIKKGEIQNVNQLVTVMIKNGWRFAPALQSDEAAYRAMHSALVAFDVALNQQVAQTEGN